MNPFVLLETGRQAQKLANYIYLLKLAELDLNLYTDDIVLFTKALREKGKRYSGLQIGDRQLLLR